VRIVWLRSAKRNLEEQLGYIGERNAGAANTFADKIAASVARLADYPRGGRPGSSRTITISLCAWEVCSMMLAMPMPRSRIAGGDAASSWKRTLVKYRQRGTIACRLGRPGG
jgi:hypothetical protein